MKALIIVAHGSRKEESNNEVLSLVREFDQDTEHSFDFIVGAFLQFASPGLEKQIAFLAGQEVSKIVIFPFFIGAGNHILMDIPQIVDQARKENPGIEFVLTKHLGKIDGIENVIFHEVEKY